MDVFSKLPYIVELTIFWAKQGGFMKIGETMQTEVLLKYFKF